MSGDSGPRAGPTLPPGASYALSQPLSKNQSPQDDFNSQSTLPSSITYHKPRPHDLAPHPTGSLSQLPGSFLLSSPVGEGTSRSAEQEILDQASTPTAPATPRSKPELSVSTSTPPRASSASRQSPSSYFRPAFSSQDRGPYPPMALPSPKRDSFLESYSPGGSANPAGAGAGPSKGKARQTDDGDYSRGASLYAPDDPSMTLPSPADSRDMVGVGRHSLLNRGAADAAPQLMGSVSPTGQFFAGQGIVAGSPVMKVSSPLSRIAVSTSCPRELTRHYLPSPSRRTAHAASSSLPTSSHSPRSASSA